MPDNNDLFFSMGKPIDKEWEDLSRYDVDTLLSESKRKVANFVTRVQSQDSNGRDARRTNSQNS